MNYTAFICNSVLYRMPAYVCGVFQFATVRLKISCSLCSAFDKSCVQLPNGKIRSWYYSSGLNPIFSWMLLLTRSQQTPKMCCCHRFPLIIII